jgi:thymidylate kinase
MLMNIAIEGLIGAGKTTALSVLSKDHSVFFEPHWSLLEPSLKDCKYAEMFQIQAIVSYAATHARYVERSPTSAYHVFSMLRWQRKEIADLDALAEVFDRCPMKPSAFIFLDVPIDVCLARCVERGTPIDREYMVQLHARYVVWFESLQKPRARIVLSGRETPEEVADKIAACTFE